MEMALLHVPTAADKDRYILIQGERVEFQDTSTYPFGFGVRLKLDHPSSVRLGQKTIDLEETDLLTNAAPQEVPMTEKNERLQIYPSLTPADIAQMGPARLDEVRAEAVRCKNCAKHGKRWQQIIQWVDAEKDLPPPGSQMSLFEKERVLC